MKFSVEDLAKLVEGTVYGDGSISIEEARSLGQNMLSVLLSAIIESSQKIVKQGHCWWMQTLKGVRFLRS